MKPDYDSRINAGLSKEEICKNFRMRRSRNADKDVAKISVQIA